MKIFLYILIGLLISHLAKAQEANQWFYAANSMLNLNCDPPAVSTVLQYGNGNDDEYSPSTSMADTNGNLLFYSSFKNVYNRQNKIMPHSKDSLERQIDLLIFNSECAVPDPGNANRYYIFFIDSLNTKPGGGPGGGYYVWDLNYAIVDMTLDSGRGDVVLVKRNILGSRKTIYGLTATRQKNKRDFWLATYDASSYFHGGTSKDSLIVLSITPNGISYKEQSVNRQPGNITIVLFSNNGKRLLIDNISSKGIGWFTLYDFDNSEGVFGNPIQMPPPPQYNTNQTLCFSPDNAKLYVYTGTNNDEVQQFDVSPGQDSAAIAKSGVVLQYNSGTVTPNWNWSDMKVASDGKIYGGVNVQNYLKTIEKPNVAGTGCTLNLHALNLATNGQAFSYFPNFVTRHQAIMPVDISSDSACTPISFTPYSNLYGPYYKWDFGDPNSGTADTSSLKSPTHTYISNGMYKVRLYSYNYDSVPDTFTRFLCINTFPVPVLKDTSVCGKSTVTLNAGNPGDTYLWNDSNTSQIRKVPSGTWWVVIKSGNCSITDTAHVINLDTATINLGNDTTVCNVDSFPLKTNYATTTWSTGQTGKSIRVGKTGKYWAALKSANCTVTDTIVVTMNKMDLGKDTTFCQGDTITLHSGYANAVWSTGATGQNIKVSATGQYVALVKGKVCTVSDTINIHVTPLPVANLGPDSQRTCGRIDTLRISGDTGSVFLWSTGDTDSLVTVKATGQYWVKVNRRGCIASDTTFISLDSFSGKNTLPADTLLCVGATLPIDLSGRNAKNITWSDNVSGPKRTIVGAGLYVAILTTGACMETDSIRVNYDNRSFYLGNDTTLCQGNGLTLAGPSWTNARYQWNTGSTANSITITSPGNYALNVNDGVCPFSDSITIKYNSPPSFYLPPDTVICPERPILFSIKDFSGSIFWQDGNTDSNYTITTAGTYTVTLKNICGTKTYTSVVADSNCDCYLFVPNIFTPNQDHINDLFYAQSACQPLTYTLQIYNRWGERVFQSNDINTGWDGTFKNLACPEGVYVYKIIYKFPNATDQIKSGTVTVGK